MEKIDEEIKELEAMQEQYRQAYIKCTGALEYVKNKKEKDSKKEDSKKKE